MAALARARRPVDFYGFNFSTHHGDDDVSENDDIDEVMSESSTSSEGEIGNTAARAAQRRSGRAKTLTRRDRALVRALLLERRNNDDEEISEDGESDVKNARHRESDLGEGRNLDENFDGYDATLRRRAGGYRARARSAVMRWWITAVCKPKKVLLQREQNRECRELGGETIGDKGMKGNGRTATESTFRREDAVEDAVETAVARGEQTMTRGKQRQDRTTSKASNASAKGRGGREGKTLGPFYHSRTFIAMDSAPREDSDDEDPVESELAEDKALLNEFIDYSLEEIDFMYAWNAVARKFRVTNEEEIPALLESFVRTYGERLRADERFYRLFMTAVTGFFKHGVVDRREVVNALALAKRGDVRLFKRTTPAAPIATPNRTTPEKLDAPPPSAPTPGKVDLPPPLMPPPTKSHSPPLLKTTKASPSKESRPAFDAERLVAERRVVAEKSSSRIPHPFPSRGRPSMKLRPGPCELCFVTETPCWRKGPAHAPVLCNRCGTRYRRSKVRGVAYSAPNISKTPAASLREFFTGTGHY